MTDAELIEFINDWIYTNHNNEITAATLNPVLQAIRQRLADVAGDLGDLATVDQTNLVAAINEVYNMIGSIETGGIKLHSGTANPNITPPLSFGYADFYMQKDLFNNPVQLFQWNGFVWTTDAVEVLPIPYLTLRLKAKGATGTLPDTLEVNDIVEGFKDSTTYWGSAVYNGGDIATRSNYTPLEETEL